MKSVNEYIGDSGRELEGAAEQIVESYMGEYMQVVEFVNFPSQATKLLVTLLPGIHEGLV